MIRIPDTEYNINFNISFQCVSGGKTKRGKGKEDEIKSCILEVLNQNAHWKYGYHVKVKGSCLWPFSWRKAVI